MEHEQWQRRKREKEDKQKYEILQAEACRVLLECGIRKLPISMTEVISYYNIHLYKNSTMSVLEPNEEGVGYFEDGRWIIVYDDTQIKTRCRFTIAHELGHIRLKHPSFSSRRYAGRVTRPPKEREADQFAARLLAPDCVLWGLRAFSADAIQHYCNISPEAAQVRSDTMGFLLQNGDFLTSTLEIAVYKNFINYINEEKSKQPRRFLIFLP